MALQGTLESFGMSEILQLISQQGKTGTLEIESDDGVARIRFLEGRLLEAWADPRAPSEFIGAMLLRAGLITQAQLDHALGIQRQSLRPLGDILTRTGALRVAEFQEMLALQHRETVYRLLARKRGNFFFRADPVQVEEGVSIPMDVGALLMEGFRQIDEWPRLSAVIPSESRVFARTRQEVGELSQGEARVLSLVDGFSTVRQIVDRSRLGDFAGWDALAKLLEAGFVEPAHATPRAPSPPARSARLAPAAIDALLGAVLLVLAAAVFLGAPRGSLTRLSEAWRAAREDAASAAARIEAWQRGRYASLPGVAGGR